MTGANGSALRRCPWSDSRCPHFSPGCELPESRSCILVTLLSRLGAPASFARSDSAEVAPRDGPWGRLSRRERDVAELLCHGARTPQMAQRLAISEHTVRNHLKGIYRKLGVQSRSEVVAVMAYLRDDAEASRLADSQLPSEGGREPAARDSKLLTEPA